MKPMFEAARATKRRLVLAEGEGGKILQACQLIVSEKLAEVTLVGRPHVIQEKIKSMGLSIVPGQDFEVVSNAILYAKVEFLWFQGQQKEAWWWQVNSVRSSSAPLERKFSF